MRALLSTIGTRGDVQPLVALAPELRSLGHEVRLCAPPDFRDWVATFGIPFVPIGPEVRAYAATARPAPTPDEMRRQLDETVATQFATIGAAAEGCQVIVGCNGIQIGARSIAERLGIPYVFAVYCPAALPSAHHPPPPMLGQKLAEGPQDNLVLWAENARRSNAMWGAALNAHRAAAGLAPVTDVLGHVNTDHPWLAADPTLAPWPEDASPVVQTGAWIVRDERLLAPELEAFLSAGDAPIYVGFGSIRAPAGLAQNALQAARALGRRVIVLRGWADLAPGDAGPDCLSIGEVNQQALFPRVAVALHHGGAGTTTAAARGGAPQLVLPQHYDQPYWSRQVERLGIGVAHPAGAPTVESLTAALQRVLQPEVSRRAEAVAKQVRAEGASDAAQRLVALTSGSAPRGSSY